jgi:hypothetical protein
MGVKRMQFLELEHLTPTLTLPERADGQSPGCACLCEGEGISPQSKKFALKSPPQVPLANRLTTPLALRGALLSGQALGLLCET